MSNFLDEMSISSGKRAATVRISSESPETESCPLRLGGFDIIAEIKERSPAEGDLSGRHLDRTVRARCYAEAGAAAISVLTEPDRFDGELSHLEEVVDAVSDFGVPVMRKDFLVDPVQIREAKSAGASGVLLIAAMLDDHDLVNMLDSAFDLGLFVLLESFDNTDLERTAHLLQKPRIREQAGQNNFLVGVNSRDLRSLAVDPLRLERFAPVLPAGAAAVAESGQRTADDAARVAALGYRMALVGTALMKATDPRGLIKDMLAAGRKAAVAE